jgi:hypothetical protein
VGKLLGQAVDFDGIIVVSLTCTFKVNCIFFLL